MFILPVFGQDEMSNALVCCLTYDYVLILRVNDMTIQCSRRHQGGNAIGGFYNMLSSQLWTIDTEGRLYIIDVEFS